MSCGRVTGTTRVHGTPGSGYASSVGRRLGQRDYRGGRNPRRETRRSAQRRRTRINISPLASRARHIPFVPVTSSPVVHMVFDGNPRRRRPRPRPCRRPNGIDPSPSPRPSRGYMSSPSPSYHAGRRLSSPPAANFDARRVSSTHVLSSSSTTTTTTPPSSSSSSSFFTAAATASAPRAAGRSAAVWRRAPPSG